MSVDYDIYKGTPKGRDVHGPYDRWTSVCATRAASLDCTPQQPAQCSRPFLPRLKR